MYSFFYLPNKNKSSFFIRSYVGKPRVNISKKANDFGDWQRNRISLFFNCIFGLKQKCNPFSLLDNEKESVVYGVDIEPEVVKYSAEIIKQLSSKISLAKIEVHTGNAYKLLGSNKYDRICIVGSSYLSKVHTYICRQRWRKIPTTSERRRNNCRTFTVLDNWQCQTFWQGNIRIICRKDNQFSISSKDVAIGDVPNLIEPTPKDNYFRIFGSILMFWPGIQSVHIHFS